MQMKFQPLGDRVLVKPSKEDEQKVGGIIIPDSAKEKPQQGVVMAIGTGGKDSNGNDIVFHVKVGDTILLPKYGGNEIKFDGETYQILRQDDILGVVNK
jgi:chaperonin GroES